MVYMYLLGILFAYYMGLFIIGQIVKDNGIVDIAWGFGFVILAWSSYLLGTQTSNALLITIMVTIWGVRLTYHIGKRNIGKPEDFRYQNFRKQWGTKWPLIKAFLHVYMLQMVMMILIASSYVYTNVNSTVSLNILSVIGLGIWLFGYSFEAIGDHQLKTFLSNPENKGQLMTVGLYKFTRHPNYFGEATLWWGVYVAGVSTTNGFLTIVSPIVITILVRFVSGVPMLEKKYMQREDFREYAKHTNVFFPWFQRKVKHG